MHHSSGWSVSDSFLSPFVPCCPSLLGISLPYHLFSWFVSSILMCSYSTLPSNTPFSFSITTSLSRTSLNQLIKSCLVRFGTVSVLDFFCVLADLFIVWWVFFNVPQNNVKLIFFASLSSRSEFLLLLFVLQ